MSGLKIRKIGNSLGVTLPQEILDELNVQEGDELYLIRTAKGFELTPDNPEFAEELEAYRYVTRKHRNALGDLATRE